MVAGVIVVVVVVVVVVVLVFEEGEMLFPQLIIEKSMKESLFERISFSLIPNLSQMVNKACLTVLHSL